MMGWIIHDNTFWTEVPFMGLAEYAVPAFIVRYGTSRLAGSDLSWNFPNAFPCDWNSTAAAGLLKQFLAT